jgi:hypothetical protein
MQEGKILNFNFTVYPFFGNKNSKSHPSSLSFLIEYSSKFSYSIGSVEVTPIT